MKAPQSFAQMVAQTPAALTSSANSSVHSSVIVLFDGVCNLCDNTVQFLLRHDLKKRLKFASQQSEAGQELLLRFGLPTLEGLVLLEGRKIFTGSDAALRLFRHLGGYWPALEVLRVFPRPLREWVYRFIARNRYRWFGKKEVCMVPTPEVRARFL
jgi:predicted DCC family thiol-disulfide oxidoreductase YuxK